MNIEAIQKKISKLIQQIYMDAVKQEHRNYKKYEEMLKSVYELKDSQLMKNNQNLLKMIANGYYNLTVITSKPKYIQITLQFQDKSPDWVLWTLQMIALTSARSNHQQAHKRAIDIIDTIVQLIDGLQLDQKLNLFVRQIKQLLKRKISLSGITNEQMFKQFQTGPKFISKCPIITKKFHIADIMAVEAIDPTTLNHSKQLNHERQFYLYTVYLSIACFTRATQKFYCHETLQKQFHYKAIQLASYLYDQKSTYLRFLYRTYFEHYKQTLEKIQEQQEQHQLYRRLQKDTNQISMINMPWENQEGQLSANQQNTN